MSGKKTICLNMIVKNEAHIIADTLEHLLKYIWFDYWVISDTGSTDNTKELIKNFFNAKGIPGELQEEPWQDFGYNRTKAFEGAYKKADYAFVWDADDEIYGDFKMPKTLNADSYKFTFGNADGMRYSRPQLFNMKKRWCYKGVLHEYANCLEESGPSVNVPGNYYFISGRRGDRSKDPNKYLKDALVLEKASEKALAEGDTLYNRYIFYCAQSYNSSNNHEKAIEFYKKALTLPLWIQEKYVACMEIYDQYELLKKPEEGLRYLVESYKHDPKRIECYYRLIKYYCINGPVEVAYAYYTVIQDFYENHYNPNTLGEKLFARRSEYDFYLPYYMVIVSERTKCLNTCAKMYELIFKYRFIAPEWWLKNLIHNIQFCINELPEDIGFVNNFFTYMRLLKSRGVNLEKSHLAIIGKMINRYKDLLGSAIKPSFSLTATKPIIPIKVMLTMTSCKRWDLFEKTVNSIIRMWTDIEKVDYFFCVDDNSSQGDRIKMKSTFPFIDFYMKRPNEKGHRASMNIIYDMLNRVKPSYWIHIEDDWLFFEKDAYIQKSIDFLERNESKDIHQVLYNRNYAETYQGWTINGGEAIADSPGFLLHVKSDKIPGQNCGYWPHYSFRPSMIRTSAILELGNYDSPNTFFERDYADKYFAKGYKSAFFDTVCCLHIGKLTSDKTGTNAYTLNKTEQFNGDASFKKQGGSTFVVNLLRRTDRKEAMEVEFEKASISEGEYEFFEAVDGKELALTDEINTLFLGNDFGSRKGVIGCALSHYKLWKQLVASDSEYYTIFEDDIKLCDGFKAKWEEASNDLTGIDLIFLGYHVREVNKSEINKVLNEGSKKQLDSGIYIGGTFSYIITKLGAKKLLDYISQNGIKHGIDYMIKIVPDLNRFNCQPHIVFSDWVVSSESKVDTDIQKDYSSLQIQPKVNESEWVFHEGVDSGGSDIRCVGRKSITEIMAEASADKRCVAFNTLGFLKSDIKGLERTPYIHTPGSGIYVKKSYLSKESMSTRQVKKDNYAAKDLIGLARKCDWFVYSNGNVRVTDTDNPRHIFLSSYRGSESLEYFMKAVLPLVKSKFNLIIAGDDFTFPSGKGDVRENLYADKQELIQTLLDNQYLGKIFVENLDTLDPKMTPIPLGLVQNRAQGYHSNLQITNDSVDFSNRTIQAFCIHRNRDGPQWELRAKVTELCITQWPFVTYKEGDTMNNEEIYRWMRKSKFCLCVRGGGYDPSPKAWEALINGCIPIIQRSPLDEAYKRFPVVFVDHWTPESLSQVKLDGWLKELRPFYEDPEKRKEVLNMLTLDYWWNIIKLPEPNQWVAPYLCGGLGNRLFQISAALGLAQKMGRELVFYKPMINNNTHHKINELYAMFPNIRIINEHQNVHEIREAELEHYSFKAISSENVPKQIVTRGYWQNYQYFPECGFNPTLKGDNLYSKYGLDTDEARKNSWFIHVRLGDYKNNGCVNHITMDSYYKKVLDQIPTSVNLILFSDEPTLAAKMLKPILNDTIHLRICDEKSEPVTLGLMSQCWGGAIVPNSTFSWWGAYFARKLAVEQGLPFKAFYPLRWQANIPSKLQNNPNPPWAISIDNTIDESKNELWDFYEGVDSGGGDIRRTNAVGVDNMKVVAETHINCVAFNSLGFLKSRVKFPLQKSPYLHAPHGIYVKKGYKPTIRIKMLCNWCSSEELCKEWMKMCKGTSNSGNYKWNNLEITWSDEDIDYYVIINKPRAGDKYIAEKSIIYHMEPWCAGNQNWGVKTWGSWAKPDPKQFLQVRSHDHFINTVFWQLSLTYDQLQTMDMQAQKRPELDKVVSSICSSKYFDPGHKKRIDFLKYLESKDFPVHIYNEDNQHEFKNYQGKAKPSVDKEKGIVPYKYYFMCENNAEHNFITEKLWEPILCESLCFYWGCPNVADIVDSRAFVQLDMNDFETAYNTMNAAIQTSLWEERLPFIKAAKQKILDQSFFPTLEKVLKPKAVCFIHSCHLLESGTEKLDLILKAVLKVKELEVITINNIGLRLDHAKYEAMDPRISVIHCSNNPQEFELPTLRLMHEFSLNSPNTKVLYVHTKGISYHKDDSRYEPGLDWINYMLYFLCEKSDHCLNLLDTHDVAGCNFSELPKPHFSGNFWWATTKYLKSLTTELLTDKMSAEWWLHSSQVAPVKATLWNSEKNHFQEMYPKENYNLIRYLSGGKLGDFIHQLSVIQENYIKTGIKAILYISNTGDHFALGLETAYNDIKKFILAQPYIYEFKIYNGEQYHINLSDWRYNKLLFHTNWHELFKSQYNVEWGTHPWLHASTMKPEFNETILFHCSLTRFPETINFSKLFETYGMKNIKFITQDPIEYMKFLDKTGIELDEYNPTSLEDFIDTVASCKLFIGCLSSPLTYALGLHKESVILLPNNHSIEITHINGLEHIFPNVKIMV